MKISNNINDDSDKTIIMIRIILRWRYFSQDINKEFRIQQCALLMIKAYALLKSMKIINTLVPLKQMVFNDAMKEEK